MIHVVSNHSSFKSGASNLHKSSFWTVGDKLKFTTYNNRHYGVQLDASHDIEGSKMKEVTQMMSALSQNPDTADKADEMYQNLSNAIEASINKIYKKEIKKGVTEEDLLKERYKLLSNNLVKSLNNSPTQNLANIIAESFEHGELVPFSNQNFFKELIKDLVVRLNKDFITIETFINLTENQYGSDIIKELKKSYNIN
jgi:hypothetical protein